MGKGEKRKVLHLDRLGLQMSEALGLPRFVLFLIRSLRSS